MILSKQQLISISPYTKSHADAFIEPLNAAMTEFEINTRLRVCAFIGQILHESGSLQYVKELASGDAYTNRKDLGDTNPVAVEEAKELNTNTGRLFKGRGLIQITGYTNYVSVMMALGIDCVQHPELLEQPINACRSAAWWWKAHGLNELADIATYDSYLKITKIINGGTSHLAERQALYRQALATIKE